MTTPKSGESQNEFISRCHSAHASEYPDQKQRHAMCMSKWRGKMKTEKSFNTKVDKALNDLDKLIKGMEKEKVYKSFVSEIPGSILDIFCSDGQRKFKQIYIDNRIAGVNKDESLELTKSLVTRAYKDNKIVILGGIYKALEKIRDRIKKAHFVGDDTQQEEFPPKDSIKPIDDDDEENQSETTTKSISQDLLKEKAKKYDDIDKAEEGDTKMVFGNPMTFSGGKWVPQDGGKKEDEPKDEAEDETAVQEKPVNIKSGMDPDEYSHWVETGEMQSDTALNLYNGGLINREQFEGYTGESLPVDAVERPQSIKDAMKPDEFNMWVKYGKLSEGTAQKLLDNNLINEGQFDLYTSGTLMSEEAGKSQ